MGSCYIYSVYSHDRLADMDLLQAPYKYPMWGANVSKT